MKPIRIFRHIACEGPGYFGTFLQNYNIPFELVRIDAGETPPPQINDVSALVFMGGPMSANDDIEWIQQELILIQKAVAANLPVLGHCLGGQLISKALGGEITANPVKEIGWLPVQKIPGPLADDWLADFTNNSVAFHWHGETFSIPENATAILRSEHCNHQGFVLSNTLALQCHVEMTEAMVREWTELYKSELTDKNELTDKDELTDPVTTVQSQKEITENLEEKITQLQSTANGLYRRWLQALLVRSR